MIKEFYAQKFVNDKELLEMINDIYDGSVRLIEIVNDFLNVSRLEQGKMEFKKETCDFSVTLEEVVHELDPNLKQKNLTCTYMNKEENLPKIIADKNRV